MSESQHLRIWVRLRPDHVAALDLIERHLNDQVKGIAVVSRAESAGWAILKAASALREETARKRMEDKTSVKIDEASRTKPSVKRARKRKRGPDSAQRESDAGDSAGHAHHGSTD